jgi:hypothetical protein
MFVCIEWKKLHHTFVIYYHTNTFFIPAQAQVGPEEKRRFRQAIGT